MKTLFKFILIMSLGLSGYGFAQSATTRILCPTSVGCSQGRCVGIGAPWGLMPSSQPIADGTYYFYTALFSPGTAICALWQSPNSIYPPLYITSNNPSLSAEMNTPISQWHFNYLRGIFLCTFSDPNGCAFLLH
jgi:hypothetical protein